jgi:hypothetical protein
MNFKSYPDLIIKNGNKVLAYGEYYGGGTFNIFNTELKDYLNNIKYTQYIKGDKLVASKKPDYGVYFGSSNIWENIKAFEGAIQ